MNVDIENQEGFKKKRKIIIICLSAALVFITLIASLFLIKKNKESGFENNDFGEVVNENDSDQEYNDDDDYENDDVIVNEGDYFFNKTSGQVTTNVLLSLFTIVLFFFWENDKLPQNKIFKRLRRDNENFLLCGGTANVYCGLKVKRGKEDVGYGIFEKANWFGFASLGFLIIITLFVEFLNHLLIGSIAHFFSKDKNKRYFHTLKISIKKREQLFSSLSKKKISFIVLSYLLCGFAIAIVARLISKKLRPCRCRGTGEIIPNHNIRCFLCCYNCEVEYVEFKEPEIERTEYIRLDASLENINIWK